MAMLYMLRGIIKEHKYNSIQTNTWFADDAKLREEEVQILENKKQKCEILWMWE